MNPEGRISIIFAPKADVEIDSSRPMELTKMFIGKSPEQVQKTISLLYRVCGTAQSAAAAEAFEYARGIEPDADLRHARAMLVLLETAKEHLLRIVTDWPGFISNEEADLTDAAAITALLPKAQKTLFGNLDPYLSDSRPRINRPLCERIANELDGLLTKWVFAEATSVWLDREGMPGLREWMNRGDALGSALLKEINVRGWGATADIASNHLPQISYQQLDERLSSDEEGVFSAQPDWLGLPCETGILSRVRHHAHIEAAQQTWGNGLMTRLLARLVELALIPDRIRRAEADTFDWTGHASGSVREGVGLSQVEAARGRLIHRVELVDNKVESYCIVAPTEWNFCPGGVVSQLLSSLSSVNRERLSQQADLLITAVDPCVGYELVFNLDN